MFTLQLNGTDQNAILVCSATGGYPPITNISLLKNGDVIASSASESTLQVNTADLPTNTNINHYGLYVCLVDLSGVPLQKSVMLKKRGSASIQYFFLLFVCFFSHFVCVIFTYSVPVVAILKFVFSFTCWYKGILVTCI